MTVTEQSSAEEIAAELAAASEATAGAVSLAMTEPRAQFLLHADQREREWIAEGLGIPAPNRPNSWTGSDPALVWMGPLELLLLSEHPLGDLALGSGEARMVDVSSARIAFEVAGPRTRELLASGCSIDLHPRAFGPGSSAITLFDSVGVILMQIDETPRYRLLVRRSFAVYLASLLLDAATELYA